MKHILEKARFASKPIPFVAMAMIFLIVGFAWAGWSSSKDKKNPSTASAGRTDAEQARQPRGPVQTVRFTLYDVGIYPRTAKARPGLVAITFQDLSGGTSGLSVTKINNSETVPVGVVQRPERRSRGRGEMRLETGRYEVFDSSRPSNRAELVIEP